MMHRRVLLNLALMLLLLLLGAMIWLELRPDVEPNRIAAVPQVGISRIVVERGGEMMRLVRQHKEWRLEEPRALPASELHVSSVLQLLQAQSRASYPAETVDLAQLGLSEPKLRVTLDDEVFVFGGTEPLKQLRYVLHDGKVHLIRDTLSALLLGPWYNFIDRDILGLTDEVVAFELADGTLLVGDEAVALLERWHQASASIVSPMQEADAARGRTLRMRLAGGDFIEWRLIEDDEPRLVRPDLQLTYHVAPELLARLSGDTPP